MMLQIRLLNTPLHSHPAHLLEGWLVPFHGNSLTLGRIANNELLLPFATVSGTHARVFYYKNLLYIEDLGSTNGTYVNGLPIAKGRIGVLRDRDRIQFGDIVVQFQLCPALQNIAEAWDPETDDTIQSPPPASNPHAPALQWHPIPHRANC